MKNAYINVLGLDSPAGYPDGLNKVGNQFVYMRSNTRTSSTAGGPVTHNYHAMHVIINVTSVTGAPSITPTIRGFATGSQAGYFNMLPYDVLVGPAIAATGSTVLKIGPGLPGLPNFVANDYLPSVFDIAVAHTNGDNIAYSISVELMD